MRPHNVYVVADLAAPYGRRLLHGVARHNASRALPWMLRWGPVLEPEFQGEWDGMIASVTREEIREKLRAFTGPIVNTSSVLESDLPYSVTPDNRQIGALAARFFLGRLATNFAVMGTDAHVYSRERKEGFLQALGDRSCSNAEGLRPDNLREVKRWAKKLPLGTAVFGTNDIFARQVVQACLDVGRAVPETISILGVDVDEDQGLMAGMGLSSIDPDAERIGREASVMLETLLAGGEPAVPKLRIPPLGVVEQASTGFPVDADPHLRAAIELIDRHGGIGIRVEDVVNAAGIGRRSLEVRFRAVLGCTIDARLRHRRIERAADWLRSTHLQVQEIATRAGFNDVYYFSAAFKKATGLSPSTFRRQHQSASHPLA